MPGEISEAELGAGVVFMFGSCAEDRCGNVSGGNRFRLVGDGGVQAAFAELGHLGRDNCRSRQT